MARQTARRPAPEGEVRGSGKRPKRQQAGWAGSRRCVSHVVGCLPSTCAHGHDARSRRNAHSQSRTRGLPIENTRSPNREHAHSQSRTRALPIENTRTPNREHAVSQSRSVRSARQPTCARMMRSMLADQPNLEATTTAGESVRRPLTLTFSTRSPRTCRPGVAAGAGEGGGRGRAGGFGSMQSASGANTPSLPTQPPAPAAHSMPPGAPSRSCQPPPHPTPPHPTPPHPTHPPTRPPSSCSRSAA